MAAAQDIKLLDNDLVIKNGDFDITESDEQHIEDIIAYNKGSLKEYPQVGIGIFNYLNSSGQEQFLERELSLQLKADGYTVNGPSVFFDESQTLTIKPNAIRS